MIRLVVIENIYHFQQQIYFDHEYFVPFASWADEID